MNITKEKEQIINKYGHWTAHNIQLSENIYTMDNRKDIYDDFQGRVNNFINVINDLSTKPFSNLRILDLACLEGGYSIEFAKRGADVIGVEIRDTNIIKANFTKEILSLENVNFIKEDVRKLDPRDIGQFDVVFCSGILYHFDSPDVFEFMESLYNLSDRLVILDTHISLSEKSEVKYKDETYYGVRVKEHEPNDDASVKESRVWASIDNIHSFWLTKLSLFRALYNCGFSSVFECKAPCFWTWKDRSTFICIKGKKSNNERPWLPRKFDDFFIGPNYDPI